MTCLPFKNRHETKISSWLPPVESWDSGGTGLPYGWEAAVDKEGKTYYINHVNKTSTYEDPRKDVEEDPPQPREVELVRDPQMGFGFVAGSEKPVIVRFVTEGGPNEHKLMPGDQIMRINGEDVMKAPREHVIELVRSCKHSVTLTVCQPQSNNTTRKSALLTAAKKAKLKSNPSRVRFAEGVVINGSPLYSPSPLDSCVPFMPNVLKVFLENGQTKSFKYDSTTTVQDVLNSLQEKLSVKCMDHFSLVTEHVKIARRNRLALLDPKDTLAKIAARPGAHHLRCVFRVTFVPKDAYDLLQKDPIAFEYLYLQCCNDMVQERFAPELKYDIALRLAALQIQQHALSSGMQGKITIKAVERECGLDRFVPMSLLETMKRKELRKLLSHFLKQNQSLCAPGQKQLTALQAKLHYLKIISELPSYGAKCFSTNLKDSSPETALLISPKFGISQITCLRNTIPITLAQIEELSDVHVTKEDELSFSVEVFLKDPDKQNLNFSMEDRDAEELVLLLRGYHRLLAGRELPVQWEAEDPWRTETVPTYHNRHTVQEAPWSYIPRPSGPGVRTLDLAVPPPPYVSYEQQERQLSRSSSREQFVISTISSSSSVDHNMNETQYMTNGTQGDIVAESSVQDPSVERRNIPSRTRIDERHPGIDYQSVISMELLEDSSGDVDVDLFEAKNDEVIRRISEMNRIVVDAETYLCDDHDDRFPRGQYITSEDGDAIDSHPPLKAADSLLLLTQMENDSALEVHQMEEKPQVILDEEISPSESDTDSTPNDSPLHRSTPIRNSLNANPRVRRDSSFGLHSPDLLPGINSGNNNIIEILKHLQTDELQLPFAEGTLYLDPDIIDLTMIPPPITPDTDMRDVPTTLNVPPTPFLDSNTLHKELEKWVKVTENIKEEQEELSEMSDTISVSCSDKGTEEASDCSQEAGDQMVDSARVVAELDHLCDTLSEMQAGHRVENLHQVTTIALSSFPNTESIDSFIASVTVPPPPTGGKAACAEVDHGDLSAFIIPPPPSSSPSTEAQNEVIARFMAAAEDMRRMIGKEDYGTSSSHYYCDPDITPTSEEGFHELQKFWATKVTHSEQHSHEVPKYYPHSHLQETLSILDNLTSTVDSEFHSGDSSGYDTLTSSLTSYGETITNDDIDSNTYNSVEEELHCYDNMEYGNNSFPSSSETTPVYEHLPSSLSPFSPVTFGGTPVTPHTRMSCVDATSPLSITSPSSTTSSDSSVILLDSAGADYSASSESKVPSKLRKGKLTVCDSKDDQDIIHSGSCDNLPTSSEDHSSPCLHPASIARSISWTSMTEIESPPVVRKQCDNSHPRTPKPPLPPSTPLQQSRLRRSFNKAPLPSPIVPKKSEQLVVKESGTNSGESAKSPVLRRQGSSPGSIGRSPSPNRKLVFPPGTSRPLNGMTACTVSSVCSCRDSLNSICFCQDVLDKSCNSGVRSKEIQGFTNGCIHEKTVADGSNHWGQLPVSVTEMNSKVHESSHNVTDTLHKEVNYIPHTGGPFHQAQKDVSTMVLHLKNLGQVSLKGQTDTPIDRDKFNAAKEALVTESRQFVTSSKLFVKSAMESSDKMIENMAVCVALLDRMFTVSELVIMHMSSDEQIAALIEKLKGVAIAYLHTVDAAQKAVGKGITDPQMGVLMHQATTLATALTSLMRTLRAISII